MTTRQTAWVAIATLTAAALGFAGARAMATGAPQLSPLTYGGVLTDKDGKPYPSAQEVVLKFYDKVDATSPKCTAPAAQAEAGTGRFSVVLPGECAQAVRDTPDLWSEATVGGGKTVLPRVHVGAVPYALEADSAKVAAGATGGLKAAMDGVAADVAGLKKGGGPKVVDGAGVVLGVPVQIGIEIVSLVTPKGYSVDLRVSGAYMQQKLYFDQKSCGGAAILPTGSTATLPFGQFLASDGLTLYAPAKSLTTTLMFASSKGDTGGCNLSVNGAVNGIELKVVTPQEVGLPDKITGPLKIVP